MRYWRNDMGTIEAGKTVEVSLDTAANVRILDEDNYQKFKKGEPQEFIGGYVRFTPYRVELPRTAHWYIVVDLGGREGVVSASMRVFSGKNIPKANVKKFG